MTTHVSWHPRQRYSSTPRAPARSTSADAHFGQSAERDMSLSRLPLRVAARRSRHSRRSRFGTGLSFMDARHYCTRAAIVADGEIERFERVRPVEPYRPFGW